MDRRTLLHGVVASTAATSGTALGLTAFERKSAKFTGLSLTTYSLKRHMKWWLGKPAKEKGALEMSDFLDYCAKLGLEAAEVTGYFFPEPLENEALHRLRRQAHLLGLDISGAAMGNNFSYPLQSKEAQAQQDYVRKWIDRSAELGAPVVRVFASRGLPQGLSDDQIIANVTANVEQALIHAEKRGVILGLENHDFVQNIDYLLRVIKPIESKWLGVIWDSANLSSVSDPYAELERIAPYAVTAQIKVMTKVKGKHVPADYPRLLRILQRAKYRGYVVLEYEEQEDPYQAIPREIRRLREALVEVGNDT